MKKEKVSVVCLRDKCTRINDLLLCLRLMMEAPDLSLYSGKPHYGLILSIEEMVDEISDSLDGVVLA